MLPDGSGFDVCRELRRESRVPIIMVTARGEEADRIVGLELGADDYVTKPFSAREVAARIRAVLRRAEDAPGAAPADGRARGRRPARRRRPADRDARGRARSSSRARSSTCSRCSRREAGRVVTRERLLEEVWDTSWFGSTKTLDVHVSALRRKLGDDPAAPRYLHTVRGVGFRLAGAGGRPVNSLRVRLLAAFAYVLVLVLVALAVPFALSVSSRVEAEVEGQAAGQAHLIAATRRRAARRAAGAARASCDAARVTCRGAWSSSTRRAGCSPTRRATRLVGTSYADRPEVAAALADGTVEQGRRRSETLDEELLYTAVPIVDEGGPRRRRARDAQRRRRSRPASAATGWPSRASRRRRSRSASRSRGSLAGSLARPLAPARARPRAGSAAATSTRGRRSTGRRSSARSRRRSTTWPTRLERVLRGAARVRRERVAPAAHAADRAAPAARGGEPEGGRPGASRASSRPPSARPSASPRCSPRCSTLAREGGERGAPQAVSTSPTRPSGVRALARGGRARRARACGWRRRRTSTRGASEEDVAIVLDNLVENALRYSPPGGDVTIEWGERGRRARSWPSSTSGPGLATDEAERVFERFARGSAARRASAAPASGSRSCARSRAAGAATRVSSRARAAARAPR